MGQGWEVETGVVRILMVGVKPIGGSECAIGGRRAAEDCGVLAISSSSSSESWSKAVISAADLFREDLGGGARGQLCGFTQVLWRVAGQVIHGTGEDRPPKTLLQ